MNKYTTLFLLHLAKSLVFKTVSDGMENCVLLFEKKY